MAILKANSTFVFIESCPQHCSCLYICKVTLIFCWFSFKQMKVTVKQHWHMWVRGQRWQSCPLLSHRWQGVQANSLGEHQWAAHSETPPGCHFHPALAPAHREGYKVSQPLSAPLQAVSQTHCPLSSVWENWWDLDNQESLAQTREWTVHFK